jgi:hypothetical protein
MSTDKTVPQVEDPRAGGVARQGPSNHPGGAYHTNPNAATPSRSSDITNPHEVTTKNRMSNPEAVKPLAEEIEMNTVRARVAKMQYEIEICMRGQNNPNRNAEVILLGRGHTRLYTPPGMRFQTVGRMSAYLLREKRFIGLAAVIACAGGDRCMLDGLPGLGCEEADAAWRFGEAIANDPPEQLIDIVCEFCLEGWGSITCHMPNIQVDEDGIPDDLSPIARHCIAAFADNVLSLTPDLAVTLLREEIADLDDIADPVIAEEEETEGNDDFSHVTEGEEGDDIEMDMEQALGLAGDGFETSPPEIADDAHGAMPVGDVPVPADHPDAGFEPLSTTLGRPIPVRDWVISPLFERGRVTLIVAPPAMGKTTFLIHTALSVASGRAWGGFTVNTAGRVLYVNGEETPEETARRFAGAAIQMGLLAPDAPADDLTERIEQWIGGGALRIAKMGGDDKVELTEDGLRLVDNIKRFGPDLVIVDPLTSAHLLKENENGEMSQYFDMLQTKAREFGCAIGIAHHTRKAGKSQDAPMDSVRGASAIVAAVRSVWQLQAPPAGRDQSDIMVEVSCVKANNFRIPPAKPFKRVTVELSNGDTVGALDDSAR